MSGTAKNTEADGIRDEVRLDLDKDAIDEWDEVSDDYAVDPDTDFSRPALSDDGEEFGDDLEEDDDDLDDWDEDDEEDAEAEGGDDWDDSDDEE
ncbi:hypothetical protein [Knoellia subterranea]|uniref:Uncharacterized protein n=1 Tax=Knoellia subterranea KCTC 19937 TaxID=1385521 RepID=A0A0A0JIM5_9MICO|nr:hypothetical protein [Knoellia subterranea]KGN36973.1 hypothetical protein N803_16285 [Knoellia subterranea KCTC 19937]